MGCALGMVMKGLPLRTGRARGAGTVPTPLNQAVAFWRTRDYLGTGSLQDLTGNGHHLAFPGSSNDPLWLPYVGTQYLYIPAATGENASAPDSAALSVSGPIEIIARIAPTDWTGGAFGTIVSKYTSGQKSYDLYLNALGRLGFIVSTDGTTDIATASTASVPFADGQTGWVKATRDSVSGDVKYYTASDQEAVPTSWTQLGATVTAAAGAIFDGTALLRIGATGAGDPFAGKIYRIQVYNGIAGTLAFDADFTDRAVVTEPYATFTEKSSNAATVTINRSASGRKSAVVSEGVLLFGTDDYLSTPDSPLLDFGATDSFTVIHVYRRYGTPTDFEALITKRTDAGTTEGFALYMRTTTVNFGIGDGSIGSSCNTTLPDVGVMSSVAGVRSVASDNLTVFRNGVAGSPSSDTTTGSLTNSNVIRVGTLGAFANVNAEYFGGAIYRKALSASEITDAFTVITSPSYVDPNYPTGAALFQDDFARADANPVSSNPAYPTMPWNLNVVGPGTPTSDSGWEIVSGAAVLPAMRVGLAPLWLYTFPSREGPLRTKMTLKTAPSDANAWVGLIGRFGGFENDYAAARWKANGDWQIIQNDVIRASGTGAALQAGDTFELLITQPGLSGILAGYRNGVMLDAKSTTAYDNDLSRSHAYGYGIGVWSANTNNWGGAVEDYAFIALGTIPTATADTIAADTFNRADSNSTMGSTDTGGKTWTYFGSSTWGISLNRAYYVTSGGSRPAAVVDALVPSCTVQVTFTAGATSQNGGIIARLTDANNHIRLIANATQYLLQKVVGATPLALASIAVTPTDGDVLTLVMSGNDFTVKINGVTVGNATDAFNNTATNHGIGGQVAGGPTWRFDNFSITT